jgi:geranylgeranyl diphosphate synthase type II
MTPTADRQQLAELLAPHVNALEAAADAWLIEPGTPDALAEAMRYSVLNGGKRLRPALVWMSCQATGGDPANDLTRRAGLAVELIHSYSLVHDDLPAMDDDVLRRGRPTTHVQFGQAMAILAGDALLTRAFGVLTETDDPRSGCLVTELARAAGAIGMVAGQVADMELCDLPEGLDAVEYIHARKTGALIVAAVRMGAICGGADDVVLSAATTYGKAMGRAFQVVDDLLDATATTEALGKTAGKDARDEKKSIVSLIGLENAQALAQQLTDEAAAALAPLGDNAKPLATLAALLEQRTH